jgi:transposase InsO family protein
MKSERGLQSDHVLHCLAEPFVRHGPLDHIRSDNGSEFTARAVRAWLGRVGVKTLYIEPSSPWENSYNESFNCKLRDELLNAEIFYTLSAERKMAGTLKYGPAPQFAELPTAGTANHLTPSRCPGSRYASACTAGHETA